MPKHTQVYIRKSLVKLLVVNSISLSIPVCLLEQNMLLAIYFDISFQVTLQLIYIYIYRYMSSSHIFISYHIINSKPNNNDEAYNISLHNKESINLR